MAEKATGKRGSANKTRRAHEMLAGNESSRRPWGWSDDACSPERTRSCSKWHKRHRCIRSTPCPISGSLKQRRSPDNVRAMLVGRVLQNSSKMPRYELQIHRQKAPKGSENWVYWKIHPPKSRSEEEREVGGARAHPAARDGGGGGAVAKEKFLERR